MKKILIVFILFMAVEVSADNNNFTNVNISGCGTGLLIDSEENISVNNCTICNNTLDVNITNSVNVSGENNTCTYTKSFSCDWFCSDVNVSEIYSWTAWNGTGWNNDTELTWNYRNLGWQQQPLYQNNYGGQCIWNVTSIHENCTVTRIHVKTNESVTGLTFKANTQSCNHCYYQASTLSTEYTQFNVTEGGIFCLWVDSRFPKNTHDPGFNLTVGGYCS